MTLMFDNFLFIDMNVARQSRKIEGNNMKNATKSEKMKKVIGQPLMIVETTEPKTSHFQKRITTKSRKSRRRRQGKPNERFDNHPNLKMGLDYICGKPSQYDRMQHNIDSNTTRPFYYSSEMTSEQGKRTQEP